jgi:hypothetical protein
MPQPWPWGLMNIGDATGRDPELGHRRHCASADATDFQQCQSAIDIDESTWTRAQRERLCHRLLNAEPSWTTPAAPRPRVDEVGLGSVRLFGTREGCSDVVVERLRRDAGGGHTFGRVHNTAEARLEVLERAGHEIDIGDPILESRL